MDFIDFLLSLSGFICVNLAIGHFDNPYLYGTWMTYCFYHIITLWLETSMTRCQVVLGLLYGDEGKGKVTKALGEDFNRYLYQGFHLIIWKWYVALLFFLKPKIQICLRMSGADNAGHTLIVKDKKVVTHIIPSGIVNGDISIIGPNCLVNPDTLREEMKMLATHGIENPIYVDERCHVILPKHIEADTNAENKLEEKQESEDKLKTEETTQSLAGANGSTKRGVRFAQSDKVLREGVQVQDVLDLFNDIPNIKFINTQHFLRQLDRTSEYGCNIIGEGAQAFLLDPNTGYYPYVTSTDCNLSGLYTTGIEPKWVDREEGIWGIAKFPVSYVGSRKYHREGYECLEMFRKFKGCEERGSTTGRWRDIDFARLAEVVDAITHNGVNNLVINKCDIVNEIYEEDANIASVIIRNNDASETYFNYINEQRATIKDLDDEELLLTFETLDTYYDFITEYLYENCQSLKRIYFSKSPAEL